MLPPLHSASVSMSGSSSLNNSMHESMTGPYVNSPYRSHSSSFSESLEQFPQSFQVSKSSHVLLQHQEQFPPPSSPVRAVTSNYTLSLDHSSIPQYGYTNSSTATARHRALSESFLFTPQKSTFPSHFKHSNNSSVLGTSSEKSSLEMTFSNLNHIPENSGFMDGSESSPHDDMLPSSPPHSSWDQSSQSSNVLKGNREKELESLFTSNRQDIERSVSLGGWMPSSISNHRFPPPTTSSRRGFSDLGFGLGFGGGIEGHDVAIGLGLSESLADFHDDNPNQVPPFIPSMSAWESFVDLSTSNRSPNSQSSNSPTRRPHSYSLGHLRDGVSISPSFHPPSIQSNISTAVSTTGSNSVLSCPDDDDDNFGIQELRLQAPEYTPSSSLQGTTPSSWLPR